jgi:hypothetical protein
MKSRSIKAKGKNFERLIRQKLLDIFPELDHTEIRVTIGQEQGEDLKLSKKAQELIPLKIECKSRAAISVYSWYEQAQGHKGELEPVVFIKQNRKKPLAVVDADYFLNLIRNRT